MENPVNRCKQPGYLRPSADPSKMSLSFAGCGFLCIYHAGVCAAIKEYAPQLTKNKMYGASAGSIVAAGLICNVCMSEAITVMLNTVSQANSKFLQTLSLDFDLIGIVRDGLRRMLPENAHELCTNKLFISLTRYSDFKNVVVSEFETREELIQAILCSSFIPFYCGWQPPKYRGVEYCDGGLSDNQPVYDHNTITVSPFSGESDICPNDQDSASLLGVDFYNTSIRVTTNNLFRLFTTLFPPSHDICTKICRQGFQDALVLLNKKGLAPCFRCLMFQAYPFPSPNEVAQGVENAQKIVSSKSRRKLESECEVWDNSDINFKPTTESLFPPILQKVFDDARNVENRLVRYLRSFRIFRWGLRFIAPAFFPFDCTMYAIRKVYGWTTSPAITDFFLQRFYNTLDFILAEIAKHNMLYSSKISCQLAPLFDEHSIKPLTYRFKRDVPFLPSEIIGDTQVSFEDSIQHLIDVDIKRDDVLIYFYTNFSVEIETVNMRRSRSLKRPNVLLRPKLSSIIDALPEGELSPENSISPDSRAAEDSGFTEVESNGHSVKKRKESCCTSTQNLQSKNCQTSTSNVSSCTRRHTFAGAKREFGSSPNKTALSSPAVYKRRPLSSDSDPEDVNEKLFVPQRSRTNEKAEDYEGDQDTDH